jgi:hypothetical protein
MLVLKRWSAGKHLGGRYTTADIAVRVRAELGEEVVVRLYPPDMVKWECCAKNGTGEIKWMN